MINTKDGVSEMINTEQLEDIIKKHVGDMVPGNLLMAGLTWKQCAIITEINS